MTFCCLPIADMLTLCCMSTLPLLMFALDDPSLIADDNPLLFADNDLVVFADADLG